jgi:DNA adenine methylase
MSKNKLIAPILKWVGGKRQLMPEIKKLIPKKISSYTYYEPFIGGGAVLFELEPKKAVINDANSELINVYKVVRDNVDELIDDLKTHKNEADYFYKIRSLDRDEDFCNISDLKKASRIIFLNKTCFNGLYRVNNAGEFNTPFGNYKNPNIVNKETLKAVSIYLNNNAIEILNKDYFDVLENIDKNSFVYFDPPYDPISQSSSFTGYTQGGFNAKDQEKLRDVCHELNEQGVKFLLSNSATKFIEKLYSGYKIEYVKASRAINSVSEKRGNIDEVLIRNYE